MQYLKSEENINISAKNNHWLDLVRASAILLVLVSHSRKLLFPITKKAQLLKFGGFLGVEIFFVLSGFLIGSIIVEKSLKSENRWRWIPRFWVRRILRTYPNYLLFLFLNLLVVDTWRPEEIPNLWRYLTCTQSLLSAHPQFFGEAWSLVIEEIFYLLLPIMMVITLRSSPVQALLWALILLLSLSLISRVAVVLTQQHLTFNQIRSTALLRLDSIMFGVLTSYYYHYHDKWRSRLIKVAPFLASFCLPVVLIAMQPDSVLDESLTLKIGLFPVANISAVGILLSGLNLPIRGPFHVIAGAIARWSYSAYLMNLLILSAMTFYLPPVTSSTAAPYWVCFMLVTIVSSGMLYHFFERGFLSWRDRWLP